MIKKEFKNNIDLENEIINYYFEHISLEDLKYYALKTIKDELCKDGSVWIGNNNFIEKQWDENKQKEYYVVKEFDE